MLSSSAFEILGPIMVGPSSSHTAGALRIALVARSLAATNISRVRFELFNSFAHTYQGHGSDKALVAGILGFSPEDSRVKNSLEEATARNLDFDFILAGDNPSLHPNTVRILLDLTDGSHLSLTGVSLGGAKIKISQINDVTVEITGEAPTLFVAHRDKPGVLASITHILASKSQNIATMRTFRSQKDGPAYTVIELDSPADAPTISALREVASVNLVQSIVVPGATPQTPDGIIPLSFTNGEELRQLCINKGLSIGKLMRLRELGLDPKIDVDEKMAEVLKVMREETRANIARPEKSLGGLLGGQAKAVMETDDVLVHALLGSTLKKASAYAMATLERSATMGIIVAAPTAGSAGVCPGAILAVAEAINASDEQIHKALWNACAIGAIVSHNASVAGAEGGCQAEVGVASAMAASAICELLGGDIDACFSAASTAITNLLGLVCDPVRGLVEHPCQDRNVIGVANAFSAAQLALAKVLDPIPFDEVVAALKAVGDSLPASLRETALGGIAATPSAQTAVSTCSICQAC